MQFLDAFRLIKNIHNDPSKALKLKMDHFSQVGVLEVFLEATPTAFLFLFLIISGFSNSSGVGRSGGLRQILIGSWSGGWKDVDQLILFCITCASSIFSSAFGVSRYE